MSITLVFIDFIQDLNGYIVVIQHRFDNFSYSHADKPCQDSGHCFTCPCVLYVFASTARTVGSKSMFIIYDTYASLRPTS